MLSNAVLSVIAVLLTVYYSFTSVNKLSSRLLHGCYCYIPRPGDIVIRRICLLVGSFVIIVNIVLGRISGKRLEIDARFQWTTKKWHIANRMVT